jgi:DNA-binding response OmpR family regulator
MLATNVNILIIEDDPDLAQTLQTALEREGYTPVWKSTGAEGVSYVRNQHPHLILLDVRLPDGTGFDFCRQIRLMGLNQPILMLTVQRSETDKVLGLEMGADDYITKPFSLRELMSRIRAQLRRAYGNLSNTNSSLLFVGDLVIDQTCGQVHRGEEFINLTPIGFRLLTYLAGHRGQVCSRFQIIESVWGFTPDQSSERIVDVQISRLREKIELNPSQPTIILTVPGIGYRLVDSI